LESTAYQTMVRRMGELLEGTTFPAEILVVEKSRRQAVVEQLVMGARRVGANEEKRATLSEYILQSIYKRYNILYGSNVMLARQAFTDTISKVMAKVTWYPMSGARLSSGPYGPMALHIFNIGTQEVEQPYVGKTSSYIPPR
jgi:hypothetical protein